MKWIKIFILYGISLYLLKYLYLDITPYILFHYPFFDFRYLIFVLVQIFWSLLFYQIVYQYVCLDSLIRLRLSFQKCCLLLTRQWLLYLLFYALTHISLMIFLSLSLPIYFFMVQLCLWTLTFLISLVFHNISSYHYVSMIFIMISVHLFL